MLLAWAVLWVVVGIMVAREVHRFARMSDTVASVGDATTEVGETLRALPLIGESVDEPADAISAAGRDAVASAGEARASAATLDTLLGVSIALVPTLPVLALYLPGRIAGARERRELARAIASGREPWVDELLARRAVVHLPYRRLREISPDPLADLRAGRHAELAAAELERVGLPPSRRSRDGASTRRGSGEPCRAALADRADVDRRGGAGDRAAAEHRGVPDRSARRARAEPGGRPRRRAALERAVRVPAAEPHRVVQRDRSAPSRAIRDLQRLRARLDGLAAEAGLPVVRTSIAGDSALAEGTVRLTGRISAGSRR